MNILYKRIVTLCMVSISTLLAWVYCIVSLEDKPVFIIVASVGFVASMYALLIAGIDIKNNKDEQMKRTIDNAVNDAVTKLNSDNMNMELERLLKATYVQIRKANSTLNDSYALNNLNFETLIQELARNSQLSIETLDDLLKKYAKIIARYNKKDTEAIISNINNYEKTFDGISMQIAEIKLAIQDLASKEFPVQLVETAPAKDTVVMDKSEESDTSDDPNKQLSPEEIAAMFEASKKANKANSMDDFDIFDHPESMDQNLIDALLDLDSIDKELEEATLNTDVIPFPTQNGMQNDASDDVQTDVTDNVQANVQDDIQTDVQNNVSDAIQDNVQADVQNNVSDAIQDNVQADVQNNVSDAIQDNIQADITDADNPNAVPQITEEFDPNKKLSPEEIAALFSSMSSVSEAPTINEIDSQIEATTKKAEPPAENTKADAFAESSNDDAFAESSNDDAFAESSKDDASAESSNEDAFVGNTEKEQPKVAPVPDLDSDPNKVLSPDEIAALFASMK